MYKVMTVHIGPYWDVRADKKLTGGAGKLLGGPDIPVRPDLDRH